MRERTAPEDRAIPLRRIQRRPGATGAAESPFGRGNRCGTLRSFVSRPLGAGARRQLRGAWKSPARPRGHNPPRHDGRGGSQPSREPPEQRLRGVQQDRHIASERLPAGVLGIPRDGGGRAGEFPVRPENPLRPAQRAVRRDHPWRNERPGLLGHGRRLLRVRPTGAWSKWAIDADLDNNVQSQQLRGFSGPGRGRLQRLRNGKHVQRGRRCAVQQGVGHPESPVAGGIAPHHHHVVRIPQSPGIRFHHAARPHLRDRRRGVLPLRGIDQPPGRWPGWTTPPAPRSGTPRCRSR